MGVVGRRHEWVKLLGCAVPRDDAARRWQAAGPSAGGCVPAGPTAAALRCAHAPLRFGMDNTSSHASPISLRRSLQRRNAAQEPGLGFSPNLKHRGQVPSVGGHHVHNGAALLFESVVPVQVHHLGQLARVAGEALAQGGGVREGHQALRTDMGSGRGLDATTAEVRETVERQAGNRTDTGVRGREEGMEEGTTTNDAGGRASVAMPGIPLTFFGGAGRPARRATSSSLFPET